jgi:simple sugar transport system ATP-binding protein
MSGGNQQKAIVAREISRSLRLLLAVQPSRGLDAGACEYIRKQLVAERDKGRGVLLVSLELDEVMDVSDRVLVIFEGRIAADVKPKDISFRELGLYMAGANL